MLGVRVRGVQFGPHDARFDKAVDRVAASATDADDLDVRPEAREDPLEFGVFGADPDRLGRGLRRPSFGARSGHDFPDDGIHGSASGN